MPCADEPSAAVEPRQRKPLGDVLVIVPSIKLLARFGHHIVPDQDRRLAEKSRTRWMRIAAAGWEALPFDQRLRLHAHRPINCGERFAKNAATPSRRSSLSKISCCAVVDIDSAASSATSCAASTSFLASRFDSGPRDAIVEAN